MADTVAGQDLLENKTSNAAHDSVDVSSEPPLPSLKRKLRSDSRRRSDAAPNDDDDEDDMPLMRLTKRRMRRGMRPTAHDETDAVSDLSQLGVGLVGASAGLGQAFGGTMMRMPSPLGEHVRDDHTHSTGRIAHGTETRAGNAEDTGELAAPRRTRAPESSEISKKDKQSQTMVAAQAAAQRGELFEIADEPRIKREGAPSP